MPWEASFTCSMKERAVTKREFDWTGNEVGKRITPPKKHRATVTSEERLI